MGLTAVATEQKPLLGLSFLLAEDNVTNQLVASQMLKALGGVVEVASDGAIALDFLKDRDYDVLLIDIEMPRVSGLDVIRAVRGEYENLKDKPIIALTAYAMEEHRKKILNVGADGLIPKPITSITQFGKDIAGIVAAKIGAEGAEEEDAPETAGDVMAREQMHDPSGAKIEMEIFDGLAASLGPRGMPGILKKADEDLATVRNQIETAAETADIELMRGASHVVVSVAGSVGGTRLQRQAEALNRLAHIGEMGAAAVLTTELIKELDGVLAFIRARRKDMTP